VRRPAGTEGRRSSRGEIPPEAGQSYRTSELQRYRRIEQQRSQLEHLPILTDDPQIAQYSVTVSEERLSISGDRERSLE